MNYWDALTATVTRSEAQAEIRRRVEPDVDLPDPWAAFVERFGDHAEYEGSDVLAFLEF